MVGFKRLDDAALIAAYNDITRLPRMADVAKELGYGLRHLQLRLQAIRQSDPEALIDRNQPGLIASTDASIEPGRWLVTTDPDVKRWLVTAAQDETRIDARFWANLLAYSHHLGAELLVAGFTYNKSLFEDHASRSGYFDEVLRPYLIHDNRMLGPVLFAAKMNILPTAVKPLSGLETYSRGDWAIFPHVKTQLVSVPSLPGRSASHVMTTGACTVPNYIEKKAGLKAEFHHSIGAVLVEVDSEGRQWCRHLGAAQDGSFQDLGVKVRDGVVSTGHRVEQITWGDIHREKLDPVVAMTSWGFDLATETIRDTGSMAHTLRPRHQAFHDLLDFMPRNHHRRGDHHFAFKMLTGGTDRVVDGIAASARFLRATAFDWTTSVVVASNHHDALQRWLREADPRGDPANARYWCELNAEMYRNMESGDSNFDVFAWALRQHDPARLEDIVFVPRNGSYLVCQAAGGVEIGMHGDEGPNGARGSSTNLVKVAVRMNVGHAHSPSILDGVYTAGLSGQMDQGYNSGPSGWSHSHIVTYASGKRALITILDGKWRA